MSVLLFDFSSGGVGAGQEWREGGRGWIFTCVTSIEPHYVQPSSLEFHADLLRLGTVKSLSSTMAERLTSTSETTSAT